MSRNLSIAARRPEHVAEVLAELMGGTAVPFPPNPGSFFALQVDEHGTGVEVYPAGTDLRPNGPGGVGFGSDTTREPGFVATHFAISIAAGPEQIAAIAAREGWQCAECRRGSFRVMEVWLENTLMVEFLPPEFAAEYLALMQPASIARRMAEARPYPPLSAAG